MNTPQRAPTLKLHLLTLIDHHAQRAPLDHHAHDLVQRISSCHRGVLGVGVVCGLEKQVCQC